MRIAVLADVHGNRYAFEAALAHVRQQGVDQMVLLGDIVVGSPDAAACWQLARSLGCPSIWGNHERYVVCYGTAEADPRWQGEQYAPVQWAASQLSEAERCEMRALPHLYRTPDAPDVLFCHASTRSDRDTVAAHTPSDRLREMYPDVTEALIVRGHNHVGQVRSWMPRCNGSWRRATWTRWGRWGASSSARWQPRPTKSCPSCVPMHAGRARGRSRWPVRSRVSWGASEPLVGEIAAQGCAGRGMPGLRVWSTRAISACGVC
jgi:hypothetical protein